MNHRETRNRIRGMFLENAACSGIKYVCIVRPEEEAHSRCIACNISDKLCLAKIPSGRNLAWKVVLEVGFG